MTLQDKISIYCKEKFNSSIKEFKELGKGNHGTGYLVELEEGKKFVVKTLSDAYLGHEYPSDRAGVLLYNYDNANKLPNHVKTLDVGILNQNGAKSIGGADEFFLLMEPYFGVEYVEDMNRMLKTKEITEQDKQKTLKLAEYLAKIHSQKHDTPSLYKRYTRESFGHSELMTGVIDIYPPDIKFASFDELTELVKKAVGLWNKNKNKTHRLSQIHGDFYYGNIVFDDDNKLTVVDRSRGVYGEPADDVVCIIANYYCYAIRQNQKFEGIFKELSEIFLKKYLELTNDQEILELIPLYWTTRSVIIFCPIFYPDITDEVRRNMYLTAMKIADEDKFNCDIL